MSTPSFNDRTDFEDADRGFVGSLQPCVIEGARGQAIWDNDAYGFLDAECPDTANPSLWRQAQLLARQGLYLDCLDGSEQARSYLEEGDLRFAAQLANHVVFADPGNGAATDLLAEIYEQLGWGCENGPWRNFYLVGAAELRQGVQTAPATGSAWGMATALTLEQIFDSLAARINGPRACPRRSPSTGTSPTSTGASARRCPTACSSTTADQSWIPTPTRPATPA